MRWIKGLGTRLKNVLTLQAGFCGMEEFKNVTSKYLSKGHKELCIVLDI